MKVLEVEFIFEETDGQGLRGKTIHCAIFNTSTFPVVGGNSKQLISGVSLIRGLNVHINCLNSACMKQLKSL